MRTAHKYIPTVDRTFKKTLLLGCVWMAVLGVYTWNYLSFRATTSFTPYDFATLHEDTGGGISLEDILRRSHTASVSQSSFIVPSKGTLSRHLVRAGFEKSSVQAVLAVLEKQHGSLLPGQKITITYRQKKQRAAYHIYSLAFALRMGTQVAVLERGDGSYHLSKVTAPLVAHFTRLQGKIAHNLLRDLSRQGIAYRRIQAVLRSLSSAGINWRLHLHPGDHYSFLCRDLRSSTGETHFDGIVMVEIKGKKGRTYTAYRYQPPGSKTAAFYNGQGVCYCENFLKNPLPAARLSSRFGSRIHPIFGCRRGHKGIDLAAPSGTPVMAAGDGIVEKVCWYSGYGKYIRLRHGRGYLTVYGHLRAYARNLRVGQPVKQGQVIAFVGATGNATGPHLHFEVLHGGRHINPLTAQKTSVPQKLEGQQWHRFQDHVKQLIGIHATTKPEKL